MDDGFRNLEDFVPSCERMRQSNPFRIGEDSSTTIIRRLRMFVPTGMITTSNERLGQHGSSLFYHTRCVGSSYQYSGGTELPNWKSSFSQMLLDLEVPDTVIAYCHLSEPIVAALSTLYLGVRFKFDLKSNVATIVKELSRFFYDHGATASIIGFDELGRLSVLSYFFRGNSYGNFRPEGGELVPSEPDIWERISAENRLLLNVYLLNQADLQDGFGIEFLTPGEEGGWMDSDRDEGGGSKVGARKIPRKPSGESSIALELPKNSEENDS